MKKLIFLSLGLALSLTQKANAQFSPNCLQNSIDISTGVDHSIPAIYPASLPSAPVLDHYWQVTTIPANTTGLVAPKCAERLLNSLVTGGWPNAAGAGWIGVVSDPRPTNTAQLSPTGNFFWNCPPATPYAPTATPTVFTRYFYVQSTMPESITINIPTFWGDDYGQIFLDGFGTGTPIYTTGAVSTTFGVPVPPLTVTVMPGIHTIDVALWDVSGVVSAIQIDGSISATNTVLVGNTCFGELDASCALIPPPDCDANFTATLMLNTTGAAPDRELQLLLNNPKTTSTYKVDYGDGGGWVPYAPAPASHTYPGPGTYKVCIEETTAAGVQCISCYEFCIGSPTSKLWSPKGDEKGSIEDSRKPTFLGTEKALKEGSVKITPNPTQGNAELRLELTKQDLAIVSLVDMAGKRFNNVFKGVLGSGQQKLNIKTDDLPNGTYNVEIRIGNQITFQRLSVIR